MTKRIFRSIFLVAMAVLLASLALAFGALYDHFGMVQENQLKAELSLAAKAVEGSGMEYLETLDEAPNRLTWIAADGSVRFDSESDAKSMENHGQREEIKEAFDNGTGKSSRFSSTLTEETLYYAQRLSDGTVLRISTSRTTVFALILGMVQPILAIFAAALLLSALLARRMSRKIVDPLNALNLDRPLENEAYDELSPLLSHIEQQHRQIGWQKEELAERKNEFYAVIRNMKEGLVLLNQKGIVLSMNPAAALFFQAGDGAVGRAFLSLERSREISKKLELAESEGHSEMAVSRHGREYQMDMSRIETGGKVSGTVILIFDVTEKAFAEQSRREFTANVSHELKTPIQTIMGSAELLERGLVKGADIPRFVGRIRAESARLVALIDDVIRLSQLDERKELPLEEIDLYELAKGEIDVLLPAARKRQVALSLEGGTAMVKGVRQMLHEIVYNLCDNAIKYNVEGGSVHVKVAGDEKGAVLEVSDTGIGIPAEHRERVFERFYRVDKSHSKETGGTGLGLSIVKHAVQRMGGEIDMKSEPGKGTIVAIRL